jgi:hypothetical protein
MGVWQGVAMDLPKVSPRPAMPDLSMPCGRATSETAISGMARLQGRAACGRPLPFWTPHAVRL